jgi:hypothetical protein
MARLVRMDLSNYSKLRPALVCDLLLTRRVVDRVSFDLCLRYGFCGGLKGGPVKLPRNRDRFQVGDFLGQPVMLSNGGCIGMPSVFGHGVPTSAPCGDILFRRPRTRHVGVRAPRDTNHQAGKQAHP